MLLLFGIAVMLLISTCGGTGTGADICVKECSQGGCNTAMTTGTCDAT
jgi:hypothetical protein